MKHRKENGRIILKKVNTQRSGFYHQVIDEGILHGTQLVFENADDGEQITNDRQAKLLDEYLNSKNVNHWNGWIWLKSTPRKFRVKKERLTIELKFANLISIWYSNYNNNPISIRVTGNRARCDNINNKRILATVLS